MFSPGQVMVSPTAMNSAPFDVEADRIQTQDSMGEKHQPEACNWMKTEEQELDLKPVWFGIKRYHLIFSSSLLTLERP